MLRRVFAFRAVPVAVAVASAACAGSRANAPVARLSSPVTTLPRPLSVPEQSVLAASNAFSFALWHELVQSEPDSNIFVSPLSASFALSMAMTGAANQTFTEIRSGLQFDSRATLADIDDGYRSLIALLTSLDPSTTMEIANSIWYRHTFPFNQSFLNDGATYFGAKIAPLDFTNTPTALATINEWVKSATHGKIPSSIDQIDGDDVMFLLNAIYFKGSWRTKFDSALTKPAPFHALAGDQTAQFMHRHGNMSVVQTPMYQAVELPYGNLTFAITAIVPRAGVSIGTLAGSLNADTWQELVHGLRTSDVDLFLPRITMARSQSLVPRLQALGMHEPFNANGADFTRMSPLRLLVLSAVQQKAYVEINEEGTVAAAVTGVHTLATSDDPSMEVHFDHPFIFVIRERLTGAIMFMGEVLRMPPG